VSRKVQKEKLFITSIESTLERFTYTWFDPDRFITGNNESKGWGIKNQANFD
jgi:hypothetical protein